MKPVSKAGRKRVQKQQAEGEHILTLDTATLERIDALTTGHIAPASFAEQCVQHVLALNEVLTRIAPVSLPGRCPRRCAAFSSWGRCGSRTRSTTFTRGSPVPPALRA